MSALPVLQWPSSQAPAWQDQLLALSSAVPPGASREMARADIRAAVCEAAGALLDVGPERIEVASTPGSAPRLLVDGADAGVGVSISHADTISVAVLHKNGAVGVDIMRIAIGSDWARVAHDYLGMAAASLLAGAGDDQRPLAFTLAWARREAGLKLRGEKLTEWDGGSGARPAAGSTVDAGRYVELALPEGFAGVVALD
jgi:4'-phosphopantetheinyl transferase